MKFKKSELPYSARYCLGYNRISFFSASGCFDKDSLTRRRTPKKDHHLRPAPSSSELTPSQPHPWQPGCHTKKSPVPDLYQSPKVGLFRSHFWGSAQSHRGYCLL